jgi:poly-beta-1,6-N-acetyl-D-glucosamine biosynthesis protein PgaD
MPEIEIKDIPGIKSFIRNITEFSFTSFVWVVWVYLFLPILNIILWLLGYSVFYFEIMEKVGYLELFALLEKMGWSIVIVFVVMRTWGYYNYWRFGRRSRRKAMPPATAEQFAEHFQISPEDVERIKGKKELIWPSQGDLNQDVAGWLAGLKGDNAGETS